MQTTQRSLFSTKVFCWVLVLLGAIPLPASGAPSSKLDFSGAQWIWSPPPAGHEALNQPAGASWFRASLAVSEKAQIQSAELVIAADNLYTVYLNGQFAGESEADPNAWSRAKRFDLARMLTAGHNVIAIEAVNTAPGPARGCWPSFRSNWPTAKPQNSRAIRPGSARATSSPIGNNRT